MKKVLIIGATGLIGSRFTELAKDKIDITPVDEKVLDITDTASVKKYFELNSFDSVLNFAAVTNVDGAEKERGDEAGITWRLNVLGPKNLAEICKEKDMFLVQTSTDFVFKGTDKEPGPYSEDAPLPQSPEALGWYGWSKNRAEEAVKNSGARSAIIRVAYPFYASNFEGKLDFAKNYLKLYDEGKLFPIFTDQTLSVLNVDDLAEPLVKILEGELTGVFHLVSSDTLTPYEFVEFLLKKTRNAEGVVQKGLMSEFLKAPGRTPRPRLGGLKTHFTEEKLGMKFKTWKEMVLEFSKDLNSGS
jgi:dTDP-4-dehydrorhamnose reductase